MQRKRIHITPGYAAAIFLMITGSVFLIRGCIVMHAVNNTVRISELTVSQCRTGMYVSGIITAYIGKNTETLGEDEFTGVCEDLTLMAGDEYEIYTIPTADDKYIRVMVRDRDKKEALQQYNKGSGRGVHIEGEIEAPETDLNYAWYEDVFGCDKEEVDARVSSAYVIRQIHFRKEIQALYAGIVLILSAVLCFICSGGMARLVITETVNTAGTTGKIDVSRYTCDKKFELDEEKKRLAKYKKKLRSMKAVCVFLLLFIPAGIFMIWQTGMRFIGAAAILAGITGLWRLYINSDSWSAIYIRNKFGISCLRKETETCEQHIRQLNERIEK